MKAGVLGQWARLTAWTRTARAHPLMNPAALLEASRERRGEEPVERHQPHLIAALDWLGRAQDASADGGIAWGYSLTWDAHFRRRGWQAPYPETTGYLIPTLYAAAHYLRCAEWAVRAERAARWTVRVQLPSGAVQGGTVGEPVTPAVFNTGQVMLGWLAAWEETGDSVFASAVRSAGRFLVTAQDRDGHWYKANSRYARADATLYNARAAWALGEAGRRLNEPSFCAAAARQLHAVVRLQRANGWFPNCCLGDPERPLLHTLAYTVRGLLEGGRVLEDEALIARATLAAQSLADRVLDNGWLSGRFDEEWRPAVPWSCLTGMAQMANNWLRLVAITGDRGWVEPVRRVLRFLKATQNRASMNTGLRGGIKGSAPVSGAYGRYAVLSWATKFFADALMRDERSALAADLNTPSCFSLA